MNKTDFESQITKAEVQETANDSSSPYTVEPINCQTKSGPETSVGNIENDSPPNSQTSGGNITKNSDTQGTLKIFAPVITHDITLPNTAKKVPMVMVPVPDSRTLMAIPLSTLSQITESQIDTLKDEQQARDLLVWNEGVGTLDGCDLRFKINQLGCLELLDSDDESENQNLISSKLNAISKNSNQSSNINSCKTTNGVSTTTTASSIQPSSSSSSTSKFTSDSIATTNDKFQQQKRAKIDIEPAPIRQISPGSSLLRDGPNIRPRPKSSLGSNYNSSGRNHQTSSLSLLKKLEQNQNSILLEKLVSKQRIDEIKTVNVGQWTIEDVKKFVDSIPGCSGYGELFELQQICGKSLMYLDQRDLLDVINVKLGPAVKIYHAISLLK